MFTNWTESGVIPNEEISSYDYDFEAKMFLWFKKAECLAHLSL